MKGLAGAGSIEVRKRLKLGSALLPGDYVLVMQVMDGDGNGDAVAVHLLDFKVAGRQSVDRAAVPRNTLAPPKVPAKTVVDMAKDELVRLNPELSNLEWVADGAELDLLLQKAGEKVVTFFRDFPDTASKEVVRMQRYLSESRESRQGRDQRQPELMVPGAEGPEAAPLVDPRGREFCKLLNCIPGDIRGLCIQLGCSKIETPEIHTTSPARVLLQEYQAEFNFFILPGSRETGALWIEDRVHRNNRPLNPREMSGFILSSGHTFHCMYLHPSRQPNSRFRYLGRENRKPRAHVLAFAQKPESGDFLARFSDAANDVTTRFLVQGFIWIDPETFQVLRMRTSMLVPERPTDLRETISDIVYTKVQFDDAGREFWLPREINVSWEFPVTDRLDLVYRNQHRYMDYRLFTVASDYEISVPARDE